MNAIWKAPVTAALVEVDPQIDFFEGGALEVPGSNVIIPVLNQLRKHFDTVVLTQDWHPANHKSFAANHGVDPFTLVDLPYGKQVAWPTHCVQYSKGAEFHPDVEIETTDLIIQKGNNPDVDSYSAFLEADKVIEPRFPSGETFKEAMENRGILTLVFTGLCRDICVADNVFDAVDAGFNVILVEDGAHPLNPQADAERMARMVEKGVKIVPYAQLQSALA